MGKKKKDYKVEDHTDEILRLMKQVKRDIPLIETYLIRLETNAVIGELRALGVEADQAIVIARGLADQVQGLMHGTRELAEAQGRFLSAIWDSATDGEA